MLDFIYEVCGSTVNINGVNLLNPEEKIETTIGFEHPIVAEGFVALINLIEYRVGITYTKNHTVTFDGDILLVLTEDNLNEIEELSIRNSLSRIKGLDFFFKVIVIEPF